METRKDGKMEKPRELKNEQNGQSWRDGGRDKPKGRKNGQSKEQKSTKGGKNGQRLAGQTSGNG